MSAGLTARPTLRLGEPSAVGGYPVGTPHSKADQESISAAGLQIRGHASLLSAGYLMRASGKVYLQPHLSDERWDLAGSFLRSLPI